MKNDFFVEDKIPIYQFNKIISELATYSVHQSLSPTITGSSSHQQLIRFDLAAIMGNSGKILEFEKTCSSFCFLRSNLQRAGGLNAE